MALNIEENKRCLSIDNFRGIVIIFLAWYLLLNKFVNVPVVLKHALDTPGIYLADIGAPCFMLAMSLSAVIVFYKGKQQDGLAKTNIKFVKRYFTIIGIGFSILAIQFALFGYFGGAFDYGAYSAYTLFPSNVLVVFGMAGLFSLCFFNLNKWWRLGIGVALIAMHNSFLFDPLYLYYINNVDFGGVLGIFSWCGYLLLTSFLSEQYFTGKKQFYITAGAAAAAGRRLRSRLFLQKTQPTTLRFFSHCLRLKRQRGICLFLSEFPRCFLR